MKTLKSERQEWYEANARSDKRRDHKRSIKRATMIRRIERRKRTIQD